MTASASPLPLDGVRVIDLSRVLAGPLCGAMLGDMGADVIKVEDVHGGDESRTWAPQKNGESASYIVNNRNKRAIALDLKSPEGAKILRELVHGADVLVENFRTGTMEEFGLGYESLAADNPRLIYCSVSAFGRTGPRAAAAGYEALLQAFSGIMSITGEPDAAPVRCGVSVLDIMTGTLCSFGIVNAILHRQQTGLGQRVDGSLLDTALGVLNFQAQNYLLTGTVPRALGSAHPSLVPYKNFRCRDGQWAFVAAGNDRLWQRLAGALGLSALVQDPRFVTNVARVANRVELEAIVATAIAGFDRDELLRRLEQADVPASPVNTVEQVLQDPQMESRPSLRPMAHPTLGEIDVVGMPLEFSRMQPALRRHSPMHGEQTDELLGEIGYTPAQIDDLRARKIVR
ncbi:CaiB/BaiF CoA transferase family protein [Lacisediminimonas profundi]|uniref:CaiB/BaiF CoA transferase family protein n=1 Tax=Lacisediminimonas profundi TaxID=2603856 RepID=UPI00124B92FF|nr:CaiB/BaiF CoA-transferase family protein [Lacisediminimonas profundi]